MNNDFFGWDFLKMFIAYNNELFVEGDDELQCVNKFLNALNKQNIEYHPFFFKYEEDFMCSSCHRNFVQNYERPFSFEYVAKKLSNNKYIIDEISSFYSGIDSNFGCLHKIFVKENVLYYINIHITTHKDGPVNCSSDTFKRFLKIEGYCYCLKDYKKLQSSMQEKKAFQHQTRLTNGPFELYDWQFLKLMEEYIQEKKYIPRYTLGLRYINAICNGLKNQKIIHKNISFLYHEIFEDSFKVEQLRESLFDDQNITNLIIDDIQNKSDDTTLPSMTKIHKILVKDNYLYYINISVESTLTFNHPDRQLRKKAEVIGYYYRLDNLEKLIKSLTK